MLFRLRKGFAISVSVRVAFRCALSNLLKNVVFCVPISDGMIIIECREPVTGRQTGEIVFDALTDTVVHFKGDRLGSPYLSPDSRKLVTVSHEPTGGTTLLVQHLTGNLFNYFRS